MANNIYLEKQHCNKNPKNNINDKFSQYTQNTKQRENIPFG